MGVRIVSPYPQLKGPHAEHYVWIVGRFYSPSKQQQQQKKHVTIPHRKGLHRNTQHNNAIQYIPYLMGAIPPQFSTIRRTHKIFKAMYTTETSVGSDSIAGHWLLSPHTDRYLMPWLRFEGGIFKEQQATFVYRLVLHDLTLKAWTV